MSLQLNYTVKKMQIILVTGLAGAGKSTALRILEDSGYYCVDNLPIAMLEQLTQIYQTYQYNKIAIGIDSKTSSLLNDLPKSIKILKNNNFDIRVVYLDANNTSLLTRYSETRRRHPLFNPSRTVEDCIDLERELLVPVSIIAHRIDTSELSANDLRRYIKNFVEADFNQLNIIIQSFGFKYGLPIDSDFVFDVRCLPNPHYDKKIRAFNGTQLPIIEFLELIPVVQDMLESIYSMVSKWFDKFSSDNRNYLTISIGCTGGQHRSVYLTEKLSVLIKNNFKYNVITRHRQITIN